MSRAAQSSVSSTAAVPPPTRPGSETRRVGDADLGELYGALSNRLERIVRLDVRAPDVVIEDACQFAWSRLIHHAHRVGHDAALSWLAKTAVHEAFKLVRRDQRELSLELDLERPGQPLFIGLAPGPEEQFEQHERLDALGDLPERQRRVLWLHALGWSYAEIGRKTGDTPRTVERQLLRARHRVRGLAG